MSTLKPWLVSMLCRLSRLESMASKWSLSSVLAGVSGAGEAGPRAPDAFLRGSHPSVRGLPLATPLPAWACPLRRGPATWEEWLRPCWLV